MKEKDDGVKGKADGEKGKHAGVFGGRHGALKVMVWGSQLPRQCVLGSQIGTSCLGFGHTQSFTIAAHLERWC